MDEIEITREKLLEEKRDYSPFLVHLTKSTNNSSAQEVLRHILDERALVAYRPWCIWRENLERPENENLCERFKVVCFTETPLDQIEILLRKVKKRMYQPDSYGLVFDKTYIREKGGGNPVFYVTKQIAKPLSALYAKQKTSIDDDMCRLLALTTICQKDNDWHWEREWRIVGELRFKYEDVYCGLCPQDDIPCLENRYGGVTFIDPRWRMNRILDQLVKKVKEASTIINPEDIPI